MKQLFTALVVIAIVMLACKKNDSPPPTVPALTTTAITNMSGSTAQSGGTITADGGASITASGIAWSKTNNTPTVTDDTTKSTATSGSFTAMLKNLEPSATYYVRAYATNSVGTGYGNTVTFNTGNGGPEAKNITIVGTAAVTNKIKVTYTYFDFENDPESGTTFQWYVANDTTGAAPTAISGATDSTYSIIAGDQNKFLRVDITPKSSAGTSPGAVTNSFWIGPVGPEPTSVTFTYNETTVTYGILTSAATGKKWLDRNLGATQVATSANDHLAYGHLFQWGRPADGHQIITWANSTTGAAVNGTTTTKATSDNPGHNLFIISTVSPHDWTVDNNVNRWAINPQGPCPFGWRLPSKDEWAAETGLTDSATAFAQLKLTVAGRRFRDASLLEPSTGGYYWSSTLSLTSANYLSVSSTGVIMPSSTSRASAYCVRCIKD